MSETNFPFQGGTAVATPPPPLVPLAEADEPGRGKILALGALAVVVVLGVVGYFLFFAGGGAAEPAAVSQPHAVVPSAPAGQPADAQPVKKKINARSFGRDPFKPLIVAAPVAASGTTTAGGTTAGGTTQSSTTTATTTTTTGTVTAPSPTTSHSFRVVSVAPDNSAITVNVDGKRYNNLKAGEVFAKYFKVVLISGTTNAFQYGEEKFNVLGTKRLTIA